MGCGESEEEQEINVQEQEPEKEEEKETPAEPEEPKIDNAPYKAMKEFANPKAWKHFETYTLHEPPKGVRKDTALKELSEPATEKSGDKYLGQVNAKNQAEGFGVYVRKKTGNVY